VLHGTETGPETVIVLFELFVTILLLLALLLTVTALAKAIGEEITKIAAATIANDIFFIFINNLHRLIVISYY
jgi:hypothetical protein